MCVVCVVCVVWVVFGVLCVVCGVWYVVCCVVCGVACAGTLVTVHSNDSNCHTLSIGGKLHDYCHCYCTVTVNESSRRALTPDSKQCNMQPAPA